MRKVRVYGERRGQKRPVEAKRPPLLPDFTFEEGGRRNLGVTAVERFSGPEAAHVSITYFEMYSTL